ncbi:MAG: magnesium protoporphyrin IX methyltransferase [Pseudorhodobacter sp.]
MPDYSATRDRVEGYFDGTATKVWERLTSDAPVSRVRATVRAGRDRMRALMLSRLPADLRGARVLDAGCGTGAMTEELAARGAEVVAVDISPRLVAIAGARLPQALRDRVTFSSGDMTCDSLGAFDHVIAMDSLIYYDAGDIARILQGLGARTSGSIVFTVAPRTPLLMAFWGMGKLFPRADRSPAMVPHAFGSLAQATGPGLAEVGRVTTGFYISNCLEYRA